LKKLFKIKYFFYSHFIISQEKRAIKRKRIKKAAIYVQKGIAGVE